MNTFWRTIVEKERRFVEWLVFSIWFSFWNNTLECKIKWIELKFFWRRNIFLMYLGISHVWNWIDTLASVIHNYYKIRKNDTFALLHFCTTTTVIYFKSVRSHHGGHKLLHGILCNILFLKKSFFENI